MIRKGLLLVTIAALFWSLSGVFVKAPYFMDWPQNVRGILLAFWRSFFAFLILIPFSAKPKKNKLLVPLGICFVVMNVSYLISMVYTTAANAIWLQNIAPFWVFIFSVIFLHQKFLRKELFPMLFAFFGVSYILFFELQGNFNIGVLWGLIAGISFAGVVISLKFLSRENPYWIIAFSHGLVIICLLPLMIYINIYPTFKQLMILIGFGALQMALPYILFFKALKYISSEEAILMALLEPIATPIWVYFIWNETPMNWTIVGALFILLGLILNGVIKKT